MKLLLKHNPFCISRIYAYIDVLYHKNLLNAIIFDENIIRSDFLSVYDLNWTPNILESNLELFLVGVEFVHIIRNAVVFFRNLNKKCGLFKSCCTKYFDEFIIILTIQLKYCFLRRTK